jgi:acetyltransferase-like isoleucine patch superfamily enzyme
MKHLIIISYKLIRKTFSLINKQICKLLTWLFFVLNGVKFKKFDTNGIPYISVALEGICELGDNLRMNNNLISNPIGRNQRCIFFVAKGAHLVVGNNVGMSSVALVCHTGIKISDNVKIGGGVCIYDTDFHSINLKQRMNIALDLTNKINRVVLIKENAFIGAHSTILKGVTVGANSIIGACSVVTKDIPDNEIWAGNPAKLIRKL